MPERKQRNTKGRIITAAWKLFYDHGYENTTIEEIILESGTSKGSFYHYFDGKDALLGTLAYLFDEKYEELESTLPEERSSLETLFFLNEELFGMIDTRIDIGLLTLLISTQLTTKGEKSLLDRNRIYYKLLRKTVADGQEKGEITKSRSVNDIVHLYALCERALIYDWCLCGGEYSLRDYSKGVMRLFLGGLAADVPPC